MSVKRLHHHAGMAQQEVASFIPKRLKLLCIFCPVELANAVACGSYHLIKTQVCLCLLVYSPCADEDTTMLMWLARRYLHIVRLLGAQPLQSLSALLVLLGIPSCDLQCAGADRRHSHLQNIATQGRAVSAM